MKGWQRGDVRSGSKRAVNCEDGVTKIVDASMGVVMGSKRKLLHFRPDRPSRVNARKHFGVLHHDGTVDHDIGNTGCRLRVLTFIQRRVIANSIRVEDGDISIGTHLDTALVGHLRDAVVFQEFRVLVIHLALILI